MIIESLLAIAMVIAAPKVDRTTPGRIVIEQADDKFAGTVSRTFSASMGATKKSEPEDVSLRLWAYGSATSGKKETPSPTDFAVIEVLVPKDAAGEMPEVKYDPHFLWGVVADGAATAEFVSRRVRREPPEVKPGGALWILCVPYSPAEKRYAPRNLGDFHPQQAEDTKWVNPHVTFHPDGDDLAFGVGMRQDVLLALASCKTVEMQLVVRWKPSGPNGEKMAMEERTICTVTLLPRQLAQMKEFAKTIAKGK